VLSLFSAASATCALNAGASFRLVLLVMFLLPLWPPLQPFVRARLAVILLSEFPGPLLLCLPTTAQPTTGLTNRRSERQRPLTLQGAAIGPFLVDSNSQAFSAIFARQLSADLGHR
ncbi:MAG TPA: hypothetical protein PKA30_00310, partial [Accumulibacter sp.]|uniref:hypothetical protein n=1 Tax=Accumulibacter sp. TaxID=2053492 RepID=UPI002CE0C3A9